MALFTKAGFLNQKSQLSFLISIELPPSEKEGCFVSDIAREKEDN